MGPIFVILTIVGLAALLAKRAPEPNSKRIDVVEERLNEVGEQVADFMLEDK